MESKTLARKYVAANGTQCRELIVTDGIYHLACNGSVPDARQILTPDEAREWYDSAAYQIGDRPSAEKYEKSE